MAGLKFLVGNSLHSLTFYEGWREVPEQGVKGMTCRSFSPCFELGEAGR